jgi:hypothetical protein
MLAEKMILAVERDDRLPARSVEAVGGDLIVVESGHGKAPVGGAENGTFRF